MTTSSYLFDLNFLKFLDISTARKERRNVRPKEANGVLSRRLAPSSYLSVLNFLMLFAVSPARKEQWNSRKRTTHVFSCRIPTSSYLLSPISHVIGRVGCEYGSAEWSPEAGQECLERSFGYYFIPLGVSFPMSLAVSTAKKEPRDGHR